MSTTSNDVQFMTMAVAEARRSQPIASAYCVGAVLVAPGASHNADDDDVVLLATGFSRELPGNTHAEECALLKLLSSPSASSASSSSSSSEVLVASTATHSNPSAAKGATCYTTMEPCGERLSGKKPCASLLVEAGVARVVVGVREPPNFIANCQGTDYLRANGIIVDYIDGFEGKRVMSQQQKEVPSPASVTSPVRSSAAEQHATASAPQTPTHHAPAASSSAAPSTSSPAIDAANKAFMEKRERLQTMISRARGMLDDLRSAPGDLSALHYIPPSNPGEQLAILNIALSSSSLAQIGSGLEQSFLSQLLQTKIVETQAHLDRLLARISDIRSRVLITGDLNAGKSTFVNALLRREVVPDDQQPCTALFCEVVDADQNSGVEEVHGIANAAMYNREDPSTFDRLDINQLRGVVEDNPDGFELLKVYCRDKRPRAESLLHNGVVDISLIDSPGLNIDSMKTTSLFAQQEEIDVIVFVVNSENHFTLSGREFLKSAGKEKAYIFIVVNRFDQIRRKDRCRKEIMDQIKEISPLTYDNVDHLVHFVSAKQTLQQTADAPTLADFARLEENLRSFILEKRARSKLAPAKVYLQNLLSDVVHLCDANYIRAERTADEISAALTDSAPAFEGMLRIKEEFLDSIDATIDQTSEAARTFAKEQLTAFMDATASLVDEFEWNGVMGVWAYARNLRNAVYKLAAIRLKRCEEAARENAGFTIKKIQERSAECMMAAPEINMAYVTSAFEDGSQEAGRAAAATMFIPLDLKDFFEFTDKLEIAKSFLPSVGFVTAGLVGYQRVASGMWRASSSYFGSSGGTAKAAFAALIMAGIGLFSFVLSDMKSVVDRKILGKLCSHLKTAGFIDSNSDRIGKGTKRVLKMAMWDFQKQFQKVLSESQRTREEQTSLKVQAELSKDTYRGLSSRAQTMRRMVAEVDLS